MPRLLVLLLLFTSSALAAGRELAPRPQGRTPYAPQAPLVAYAGGRYLTVWLESLDRAGWRILGAFSDREGRRLSPAALVIVPFGIAGPAHLIGTGDSFALFWPLDDGLLMKDVDLAGHVTATRFVPIAGARFSPSVAWNGTHFAAVAREGDRVSTVFFDRAGNIARSVDTGCRPTRHKLLAVDADIVVAGVCDGAGLRLQRIAPDGSVSTMVLDPTLDATFGLRIVAAPAPAGTLFAWVSGEFLKTAIADGGSTTSAQGDALSLLTPLFLFRTPDGFLLPYSFHGNLRVASLRDDGSLIALDERPTFGSGHGLSVASDGTGMLVADLYYDAPVSRGNVRTRLVGGDAQVRAPELLSIVPARQSAPILGAGNGTLLAAWTETQGVAQSVRAARIAPDGTPLGSAVVAENASLWSKDLAWNGAGSLTVIASDGKLRAQRITPFGEAAGPATILGDVPLHVPPQSAVAWAGDRWLVAWTNSSEAFLASVASTGEVTSVRALPLAGTLSQNEYRSSIGDIALAVDGSRVFVAWIEGQTYPCRVTCLENRPVFVTRIDRDGDAPVLIGHEDAIYSSLSMTARDGEAVVVASNEDGRSLAATVDARGSALRVTAEESFEGPADVTWDGANFVVAIRERDRLLVRRVDASLRNVGIPRASTVLPQDTLQLPSVAAVFGGNAIVGTQECDAGGGRAVAFVERELGPGSQRRRTIRR